MKKSGMLNVKYIIYTTSEHRRANRYYVTSYIKKLYNYLNNLGYWDIHKQLKDLERRFVMLYL